MRLIKHTLSWKLFSVFFPSIMAFLVFCYFFLGYKNSKDLTEAIDHELRIIASGVVVAIEDFPLDSASNENRGKKDFSDLSDKLLKIHNATDSFNISLIKKEKGGATVLLSSREIKNGTFKSSYAFSPVPEALSKALTENVQAFTVRPYVGKFGKVLSLFTPVNTSDKDNAYFIGIDYDCLGRKEQLTISVWLTIIPVFLFCMGCLAVVIFLVKVFFVNPLKKLKGNLDEIGSGEADLCMRLPVRSDDEISDTAASFNRFIERLNLITIELKKHAVEASFVEKNLVAASKETSASVTQIHGNSVAISKSMENLNRNAVETNSLGEEIITIIKSLAHVVRREGEASEIFTNSTDEMVQSVMRISTEMDKAELLSETLASKSEAGIQRMNETEKLVSDINLRIQSIGAFVKIINDISEKTNMLAMNAAIEAAHAGEAGKGFSVVASEIRNLADQSKKNAHLIVDSLSDVIERTGTATSLAQETKESFSIIDDGVHQGVNAFSSIREHAEAVSTAALSIKNALENLRKQQQRVKESSEKLEDVSSALTLTGNQMEKLSSEVTADMGDIVVGMDEIEKAQLAVAEESAKVSSLTSAIREQMDKFKTE